MDIAVYRAFTSELTKLALSPQLVEQVLARRAAQGVGGAAALGRDVAHAAGRGATTSREALAQVRWGQHRLQGVVEGGRAARQAQTFDALKSGLRGRIQAAEHGPIHDYSGALRDTSNLGSSHPYHPAYVDAVTASPRGVVDPSGILSSPRGSARAPSLTQPTPPMGASVGGAAPDAPMVLMPRAAKTRVEPIAAPRSAAASDEVTRIPRHRMMQPGAPA